MAFDIFSQPQGPTISPSLFGDAATQGAQQAARIPSVTTSIVEGVKAGVKDYVDFSKGINEVNQIPIENQIRQTQLKNEQAIARINTQKADLATKTENLQLQDTEAELQNKTSKATTELDTRNRGNELNKALQEATPQEQAQIVLGGQYQDVFNSNPKLFESALKGIYANQNNGVDQATRDNIGVILRRTNASDPWAKLAFNNQKVLIESTSDLTNTDSPVGSAAQSIAGKLGILPTDVPSTVEMKESGKYKKNDEKTALVKDFRGNFIPLPFDKQEQPNGKFDAVTKDGTIVFPDADIKVQQGFTKYTNALSFKKYPEIAANKVAPPPKQQAAQEQTGGPFDQPQDTNATASFGSNAKDPIDKAFQERFRLSGETFSKVSPEINSLKTELSYLATVPGAADSAFNQKALSNNVSTVARSIANAQFDASPTIQAQNSEIHVKAYNDALMQELKNVRFTKSPILSTLAGEPLEASSPIAAFGLSVLTPKDLYFAKQRDALEAQVNGIVVSIFNGFKKSDAAPVLEANSNKAAQTYLSALKNGAPAR